MRLITIQILNVRHVPCVKLENTYHILAFQLERTRYVQIVQRVHRVSIWQERVLAVTFRMNPTITIHSLSVE